MTNLYLIDLARCTKGWSCSWPGTAVPTEVCALISGGGSARREWRSGSGSNVSTPIVEVQRVLERRENGRQLIA